MIALNTTSPLSPQRNTNTSSEKNYSRIPRQIPVNNECLAKRNVVKSFSSSMFSSTSLQFSNKYDTVFKFFI